MHEGRLSRRSRDLPYHCSRQRGLPCALGSAYSNRYLCVFPVNGGARGNIIQNFELLLLDPVRVGRLCAGIRPLCGGEGGNFA